MGVRFACHACGKRLNIKFELAGRRGICPQCETKFRIPREDAEFSIPLDELETSPGSKPASNPESAIGTLTTGSNGDSQANGIATAPTVAEAAPDSLLGGADATWYVRPPSGGQYGPADGLVMKQWISEGRVSDTAMVWRDGWNDWQPASSIVSGINTLNTGVQLHTNQPSGNHPGDSDATPDGGTTSVSASTKAAMVAAKAPERPTASSRNPRIRAERRITLNVALAMIFVCLLAVLIFVVAARSGG
ncbi:MAG: DUF4339 domain-containing protein [Planctomycetota bacterium]